jgi:putative zinc finger/helix-turn-helix YgiT family protein
MKPLNDEIVQQSCYECHGATTGRRENYNYSECGLKNVVLKEVLVHRCSRCGAARVEIPNMDGLHRTIALMIIEKPSGLSCDEIRFLRTVAGLTATKFAKALGVTKNALSRWENNHKAAGAPGDRAIRMLCGLLIIQEITSDQANTGSVNMDEVQRTLVKLTACMAQEAPKPRIQDTRDDGEAQILIDPAFPFVGSFMAPLPQNGAMVQ